MERLAYCFGILWPFITEAYSKLMSKLLPFRDVIFYDFMIVSNSEFRSCGEPIFTQNVFVKWLDFRIKGFFNKYSWNNSTINAEDTIALEILPRSLHLSCSRRFANSVPQNLSYFTWEVFFVVLLPPWKGYPGTMIIKDKTNPCSISACTPKL